MFMKVKKLRLRLFNNLMVGIILICLACSCNHDNEENRGRRSESVQCGALTKKHKPCKRMTKSPNGYCWQHGGN